MLGAGSRSWWAWILVGAGALLGCGGSADVDFRSGRTVQDAGVGDTAADVRGSRDADGSSHISDAGSQDAPPDVTPDLTVEADAESPVTVSICPQTTTLLTGESMAFRAAVTGTTELTVDWTVLGDAGDRGVMTEPGLYIAPSTPGRYQVRAASRADPSKGDVATVTVIARTAVPTISGTVQYVGSPRVVST